MAVRIESVENGSWADQAGVAAGETLLSINSHEIFDVLDYRFYETNANLRLLLRSPEGTQREVLIRKGEYDSIGLIFETYLMDRQHSCRNRCIFCFIDQLPKGMRSSLYFKDDDARLSFLFGNYITLTNLSDREVRRILEMHISPVNVSVHTMNPDLRVQMMGNRFAGEKLSILRTLCEGGISVNCQLVLCPGINDGSQLRFTLDKLLLLGEKIASIACVPVGLTRYREGLYPLRPYTKEEALETIAIIEEYAEKFRCAHGARTVFASDEFYLLAEKPFPPFEYYEDFPQLENGVGLFVNMEDEFSFALEDCPPLEEKRAVTVITGEGAQEFIGALLKRIAEREPNFSYRLIAVKNEFFGGNVSVAGLLTGGDVIRAAKGKIYGGEILLPGVSLRREDDVFLDDVTLAEAEEALGAKIIPVGNGGGEFLFAALGRSVSGGGLGTYPAEHL